MSTMISDIERINHFEWRLKRLEDFIGKSDKKNIIEIINDLNEKIIEHASNMANANILIKKADMINHLTSSDFQRYLMRDRSTKLELILADDERIRDITKKLSEIDTLARVLDGEYFQEIPKLFNTLSKLLTIHNNIKNQYGEFTEELSTFLQDYAAFTLMMDENLQHYKTILHKNQQRSSIIEDNPIE
ncbi:unnamed protein product [Rotaria sordida]|uniref:Uncharacterized protein n=1 Tax=Rotaria sordida TaxID=392033 RepID=A0A814GPQ1_9BILA|nr:unnamed protein product [Rotaria sordida]